MMKKNRSFYEIALKSYLCHASGEGDLFVDTDITTDFVGLPVINGRAIKGLLRESMEEVLDRKRATDVKDTLKSYFGKEGYEGSGGKISFISSGVIPEYEETFLELYKSDFTPNEVKEMYTKIVSQTKVDLDGTAVEGSLRFTRTIDFKKQDKICFYIDSEDDLEDDHLFSSTLLNLRTMGLNRNRGFGKVSLSSEIKDPKPTNSMMAWDIGNEVALNVRLKEPVILPKQIGDQNTIYTEEYIRGNVLLGALAYAYLRQTEGVDQNFIDAFVNGKLTFSDLSLQKARQLPKNIVSVKYKPVKKYVNTFDTDEKYLKKESGLINSNAEWIKANKMFAFHMSRMNNRTAGTSTKTEGSIFYHEYLVPFQTFTGSIKEHAEGLLSRVVEKLGRSLDLSIGASKSAQYGKVELEFVQKTEITKHNTENSGRHYLVLESPCLIYNVNGFPSVDLADFKTALGVNGSVEVAASQHEFEQRFNGQWKSKTPSELTWAAGSTFVLGEDVNVEQLPEKIGENTHTGLGEYTLYTAAEMEKLIQDLSTEAKGSQKVIMKTAIGNKMQAKRAKNVKYMNAAMQALKVVVKPKKIPNSALYTLESKLNALSVDELVVWLKKINDKQIGKKLKKAQWYERLLDEAEKNAEDLKIRWSEIIKQQLVINKTEEN